MKGKGLSIMMRPPRGNARTMRAPFFDRTLIWSRRSVGNSIPRSGCGWSMVLLQYRCCSVLQVLAKAAHHRHVGHTCPFIHEDLLVFDRKCTGPFAIPFIDPPCE